MRRSLAYGSLGALALWAAACSSDSGSGAPTVGTGRVIGRIEIADGLPAVSCLVALPGVARAGRCAPDGSFDINGVAAGKRALQIVLDPDSDARIVIRRIVPVAVNPGFISDTGALRVLEAGSVGGRITAGGSAPPFSIISVPGFGAVTAATDKGYLLPVVPPGKHTVVLTTSEGGQTSISNVEVKPGQTTAGVDFNLSGIIKGNVDLLGQAKREGKADDQHGGLTVEVLELRDGKVLKSATTQSDGAFTVNVPRGNYAVRVSDENNPIKPTLPYVLVHGEEPVALSYPIVVPSADGDLDGDGVVNADDDDIDGDGVPNDKDAFPHDPFEAKDADKDGLGDRADLRSKGGDPIDNVTPTPDTDGDGRLDFEDNCKDKSNPQQQDRDGDKVGDACDNCPGVANADQIDSVGDGTGDKCRVCIQDAPCTPANACHQGRLTCTSAGAVCADSGSNKPDGVDCGAGQVCSGGRCVLCNDGERCVPTASKCNLGTLRCTSGAPVCTDAQTAAPDGTPCDTDKVCSGGSCVACKAGGACDPKTLCRQGTLECSSGTPQCVATSQNKPDGSSCGTGLVCKTGQCVQCVQAESCQPQGKPCNNGALECSTGTPTCVDTQTPAVDGTPCGSGQHCQAGSCTTLPNTLTIVSGDAQSGFAGERLAAVVVQLTDGNNQPLSGETLVVTAPPGASVTPASAQTDGGGKIAVVPQLGPAVGPQTFTVRSPTAGTLVISATATSPPAGKSQAIVNRDQAKGDSSAPKPAVDARMNTPRGVATASDGTIYIADGDARRIRMVRPDGTLVVIAGSGSPGFSGDFGPAKDAVLGFPEGIALDEPNKLLYIADSTNNRVRVIDLSTPARIIRTVAGGGPIGAPTYGDGGLATNGRLQSPKDVSIGSDGALYIADYGHARLRRVDSQGVITTIASSDCSGPIGFASCVPGACRMAWSNNGELFFAADLCGSAIPGGPGILRRDSSGALHLVGGGRSGVSTAGRDAHLTAMTASWLAFDSAGNLIYSETSKHRIRRIDATSRVVTQIVGTSSAGKPTDFSDATTSPVNSPAGLVFDGDDLIFADRGNHSVRRVALVDLKTPSPTQLAIDSGSNQSVLPTQLAPAPLKAKVTRGGAPVGTVRVDFARQDGSIWMSNTQSTTDTAGIAVTSARAGILPGSYTIEASLRDIHGKHVTGSPTTFTITATTPSAGTIYAALNVTYASGYAASKGPSTMARAQNPAGLAVAADGTIYASIEHLVARISPRGEFEVIAGTTTWGYAGDTGPAARARFNTTAGLALDEQRKRLYIADQKNDRVRVIDLQSNIVTTYAGGGASTLDNVVATSAKLTQPRNIALDGAGNLYITQGGSNRVRVVNLDSRLISTLVTGGVSGCASATLAFASCSGATNCPIVGAASGGIYLGGLLCGSAVGGNTTVGIVHVAANGQLTHVAGRAGGSTSDGAAATAYELSGATGLARDGNTLYLGNGSTRIVELAVGGTIARIAGNSSAAAAGDYGPATAAQLSNNDLAVLPGGHLLVSDYSNRALRVIW